jgi:acyl-CoA dehydrogenase
VDFSLSPRSAELLQRLRTFAREEVLPVEERWLAQLRQAHHGGDWQSWEVSPEVEALKARARALSLWNLFLPDSTHGQGLTTLEYAPLAEEMGRSRLLPEVTNCNAPDTGNMEVLHYFGTPEQKARWLTPLLAGEIRSVFFMTEPEVASSDATNLRASIVEDGEELVLQGTKWWSTGVGHPRAKVGLFLGMSDPEADRHQQHSLVLVPLDTPGLTIRRMLSVFGEHDEPYGHGEVHFDSVRVPRSHLVGRLGGGFEIAQRRLGPGRIHHCMRALGAAERALELLVRRGLSRVAFGKPLIELDGNREKLANLRIALEQARLLVLHAAWKIDQVGARNAMSEISAIKVVAPNVLQQVVDEAIQIHGAAGLSSDFPLAEFYGMARMLRLADGPDAVHRALIAKLELAKYRARG